MKKTKKITLTCALSLLLTFCIFLPSLTGCVSKKDQLMSVGDSSIEISYYELLLSRIKGEMARTGYDVNDENFWNSDSGFDGKTVEEYYNELILENCKTSLAAVKIFDSMELTLPTSYQNEIDEEIAFYIDYDGNGSKKEFELLISDFGVDVNALREAYIIEAKISYLKTKIYGSDGSLIGDEVKDEYYRENYMHFKQVLIANYYYEYVTDELGNEVYYDTEGEGILYDKEKGEPALDMETGKYKRDPDGNVIYYDSDGTIVYDTENGIRKAKEDKEGNPIVHNYTDEEMKERTAALREEMAKVPSGDTAAFERLIEKYSDIKVTKYTDGYYVSEIDRDSYDGSMTEILDRLSEMEVGEIAGIESEYGLRYIMKYELEKKAYDDDGYKELFESFLPSLIEKMFLEKCAKESENIKINEDALKRAKSVKNIGINYNY